MYEDGLCVAAFVGTSGDNRIQLILLYIFLVQVYIWKQNKSKSPIHNH